MIRSSWMCACVAVCLWLPAQARAGLIFNYTLGPELTTLQGSNPALAAQVTGGFAAAGALWSAILTDNVVVNVQINYKPLGANTIGNASSQTIGVLYSSVKTALTGDATSTDDALAVANLPVGPYLSFLTNDPVSGFLFDDGVNTPSANNAVLDVSRANAKALGLLPFNDSANDATITFSSDFGFDFDRTNGISGSLIDFIGVAAHEIGHAMGFFSGVDVVDITSGAGPSAPISLDIYRVFSVWDLYRYGNVPNYAGTLDYSTYGSKYFSIDGGTTNLAAFSTGKFNGDGAQASHWKDGLGLGVMDPTAGFGELLSISALDQRAFDVMGWNLSAAPEPSTMVLFGLGVVGVIGMRRRKNTAA